MIQEFRDFIKRGNVIDLAVAVVIGGAFALVVTSFTEDVLMPIVAAVIGEPDFSQLTFDLGESTVFYGSFITAVVNFVIIAFAIFLIVKAINAAQRTAPAKEDGPTEVELLADIRDAIRNQN